MSSGVSLNQWFHSSYIHAVYTRLVSQWLFVAKNVKCGNGSEGKVCREVFDLHVLMWRCYLSDFCPQLCSCAPDYHALITYIQLLLLLLCTTRNKLMGCFGGVT